MKSDFETLLAKLPDKRAAAVVEYFKDFDKTKAMQRAGFKGKKVNTTQVFSSPDVAAAVEAGLKEYIGRADATAENTLREIAAVAFSNMGDYADWSSDGIVVRDSKTLTRFQAAAIAEIRQVDSRHGKNITVKLHPKITGLDMIMRHLGEYKADKLDPEDPRNLEDGALEQRIQSLIKKLDLS